MLLEMELELIELCERFIHILSELKEESLITDDEFDTHSMKKKKFIEDAASIVVLQ